MEPVDVVSVLVVVVLIGGLAWARRMTSRVVRAQSELTARSKARQAYASEREAARVRISGATR